MTVEEKTTSEEHKFYFWFFIALGFLFSMAAPFSYGDLAVWIAEGRQILLQKTIYVTDAYSFNPTTATPYPWLSSLFYYFLDTYFGTESIFFIHRLIPVLIVVYWFRRYPQLTYKQNWPVLLLSLSGLGLLIIDRPALLVLPLIVYFYEQVESDRLYKNPFRNFIFLALWPNLHGSFILIFVLAIYQMIIQLKKPNPYFALYLLAPLVNPWGFNIFNYVLKTATVSKMRMTEWQRPLMNIDGIQIFIGAFVLIAFCLYRKKILALVKSPMFVFLVSALLAIRNIPLFFAVLPLFWGRYLFEAPGTQSSSLSSLIKTYFNRAIILSFFILGLFLFFNKDDIFRKKYDDTSCFKIAEYLNSKASGKNIFNEWLIGSFLMTAQENKIFFDTRNIIYSNQLIEDYVRIRANYENQSEKLLQQYSIYYIVVDSEATALTKAPFMSQNWTFIMEDNGYLLFERK